MGSCATSRSGRCALSFCGLIARHNVTITTGPTYITQQAGLGLTRQRTQL